MGFEEPGSSSKTTVFFTGPTFFEVLEALGTAILLNILESRENPYLLFDQKNVLQKIWKPESTNTVIFLTILESKERSKISSI